MAVLSDLLPLVSALAGAGITYALNVLGRRRFHHEDLVNAAIAAVKVAEVNIDWLASVGQPNVMTDEDYREFQRWLVTEGLKGWATKVTQANEALARVVPYIPGLETLMPFTPDASHRGTDAEIVAMLRAAVRPPRGRKRLSG